MDWVKLRRLSFGGMKYSFEPIHWQCTPGLGTHPTILNVFIKDADDGLDCAHSTFAGDIKLGEVADTTPQHP